MALQEHLGRSPGCNHCHHPCWRLVYSCRTCPDDPTCSPKCGAVAPGSWHRGDARGCRRWLRKLHRDDRKSHGSTAACNHVGGQFWGTWVASRWDWARDDWGGEWGRWRSGWSCKHPWGRKTCSGIGFGSSCRGQARAAHVPTLQLCTSGGACWRSGKGWRVSDMSQNLWLWWMLPLRYVLLGVLPFLPDERGTAQRIVWGCNEWGCSPSDWERGWCHCWRRGQKDTNAFGSFQWPCGGCSPSDWERCWCHRWRQRQKDTTAFSSWEWPLGGCSPSDWERCWCHRWRQGQKDTSAFGSFQWPLGYCSPSDWEKCWCHRWRQIQKDTNDSCCNLAAKHGHLEVVRLLIEKGADATAEDKDKKTPLHFAAANGHLEVVRLLIEKGADATAEDEDKKTPMHLAAFNGHVEVVRLLIEKGADATAEDKDKKIPLHLAAENGHLEVVRLLIEKGADATAEDKDKKTPVHLAAFNGHLDIVRLLIEKSADATAEDKDKIPRWHHFILLLRMVTWILFAFWLRNVLMPDRRRGQKNTAAFSSFQWPFGGFLPSDWEGCWCHRSRQGLIPLLARVMNLLHHYLFERNYCRPLFPFWAQSWVPTELASKQLQMTAFEVFGPAWRSWKCDSEMRQRYKILRKVKALLLSRCWIPQIRLKIWNQNLWVVHLVGQIVEEFCF